MEMAKHSTLNDEQEKSGRQKSFKASSFQLMTNCATEQSMSVTPELKLRNWFRTTWFRHHQPLHIPLFFKDQTFMTKSDYPLTLTLILRATLARYCLLFRCRCLERQHCVTTPRSTSQMRFRSPYREPLFSGRMHIRMSGLRPAVARMRSTVVASTRATSSGRPETGSMAGREFICCRKGRWPASALLPGPVSTLLFLGCTLNQPGSSQLPQASDPTQNLQNKYISNTSAAYMRSQHNRDRPVWQNKRRVLPLHTLLFRRDVSDRQSSSMAPTQRAAVSLKRCSILWLPNRGSRADQDFQALVVRLPCLWLCTSALAPWRTG